MTRKTTKGLKSLENDAEEGQSVEDWFSQFKEATSKIFEGATDICITKYCPHLDKMITMKTNPFVCECEECIKDMENEANSSD
jgi:hypothetical protein